MATACSINEARQELEGGHVDLDVHAGPEGPQ